MSDPFILALDLGGTQVRAALVWDGHVRRRAALPIDVKGGPQAVMAQIDALVAMLGAGDEPPPVCGVGVCIPGPLDTETGVTLEIPTLPGWDGFPLRDALQRAFGRPTILENDAIAAAVGEWRHGAGRGLKHMVYVTVSTGIGGGAIVDGRPLHGRRGMAGHFGHISLTPNGPRCSCGRVGCFEALASGSALGLRAQGIAGLEPGRLRDVARQRPPTAADVVAGAREGDAACRALIVEEAEWLGAGFVNLIHAFSPERVVMGGGVAAAFDLLSEGIQAVIARDAMAPFRDVVVAPAALGENSGLVGAAALAQQAVAD